MTSPRIRMLRLSSLLLSATLSLSATAGSVVPMTQEMSRSTSRFPKRLDRFWISNSGVLFFNTLFDENASCHFAFGEAYPMIKGSENMSRDELEAHGVNVSMTHVDFMVGSEDLEITGITHDGEEIAVFRNGNFAF